MKLLVDIGIKTSIIIAISQIIILHVHKISKLVSSNIIDLVRLGKTSSKFTRTSLSHFTKILLATPDTLQSLNMYYYTYTIL